MINVAKKESWDSINAAKKKIIKKPSHMLNKKNPCTFIKLKRQFAEDHDDRY
jgi:hypothetical protein